ncbi:hypothetical protein CDD80_6332 [Ophiocordyceps camponoti-rufipedis]|uniref:SUR7 protein n=1 Tax=Ophiocordyceps camponoti-rufipedis TaxID=2004952 RepID=A0A2C5YRN0_9HYPO|nr:hypothetical protein CDD80_6332 [Ophiocordyceps camponoti-rufipedis]
MAVGRFICVAIPLILTVAAIITALVATLAGVTHQGLPLFSVNATGLSLNANNLVDLASKVNVRQLRKEIVDKIPKEIADKIPPDLAKNIPPELAGKINADNLPQLLANNVTASTLGLPPVTEVSLWGYCQLDRDGGSRNCTKPQFDWASTSLNSTTTILDSLSAAAGSSTRLPDEVRKALQAFRTITKWTEIAFVVALIALGLELLVGIFATCSRVASCLTWVIASIAAVLMGIAAGLATATASIVTGAVDAAGRNTGLDATVGKKFFATVWIAFAFAAAAAILWLLTICCCKPEHRSSSSGFRSVNRRRDDDRENLVSGGKGYAPVVNEHGASGGLPQGQPGQAFSQYPPRYPSNTARPDMAYEPYSHRA